MASETWTASHPLVRWLQRSPRDFDFFELLKLIETIEPQLAPLGEDGPVRREGVRLRPHLGLGFPPADIATATWTENAMGIERLQVESTFMGLYGSDSPLAAHFTESLLAESEPDMLVRDFLDLFHHRILSLLFRVWKKYRYYVTFRNDGKDPISLIVRGFLGLGTPNTAEQLDVPVVRLFRYVGLLAQRPRSAAGLGGLLEDFFQGIPFRIEQCSGRWLPIDSGERNILGGKKCSLGQDFLLGERIFDRSGKFRVVVGPVNFENYLRFLPTGDAMAQLREVCNFFSTDPLDFDSQVILRGDEVPDLRLGSEVTLGRIAWTSWVKSKPVPDQAVVFSVPRKKTAPRTETPAAPKPAPQPQPEPKSPAPAW